MPSRVKKRSNSSPGIAAGSEGWMLVVTVVFSTSPEP
jgi:hypothetical protein